MRAMTRRQEKQVREIFAVASGRLDRVEQAYTQARKRLGRKPTAEELKDEIRRQPGETESSHEEQPHAH